MELFNRIVEYLESEHLFKSADKLKEVMKSLSFDSELSEEETHLLQKLNLVVGSKENKEDNSEEKEAVMENLMTKLLSKKGVAHSKAVDSNPDGLFQIKAFKKMISCADQLFMDSESANNSSQVLNQTGQSSSYMSNSRTHLNKSYGREVSEDFEDEYENDFDPGYEVYECKEEDVEEVSRQLAAKFNFPERSTYHQKRRNEDKSIYKTHFPGHIKFPNSQDSFYPKELDGVTYDCFNLKVVTNMRKTGFEEKKEFPVLVGSMVAGRYKVIEFLGSAAFSKAIQCLDVHTDQMVCLKIIENNKDYIDQSIDEIKLLLYTLENGDPDDHNTLKIIDFFYHREHLIIVTELLRDNLYEYYKFNRESEEEPYFTLGRIQKVAYQVLKALEYFHSLRLLHCDLKPENILIKSYSKCVVKIIDLGSSCYIHDHLSSYVQSRSYRAPEVILGCKYNYGIDIWSLGCILAELWTGNVLFQNECIQGLIARIISIVGPFPDYIFKEGRHINAFFTKEKLVYKLVDPNEETMKSEDNSMGGSRKVHIFVPKKSSLLNRVRSEDSMFIDFLSKLLCLDIEQRPTAAEALAHPWLTQCKYPDGLP